MPSTIQFANAEQLMYFLQLYQQYYAAAQTGATPVDIAVGLQFTETGGKIVAGQIGSSQISGLLGAGTNYPATTAGQAFSQYIAAGGSTSTGLAATGTAANEVVANGAVATTSTGAKVVGLLSMNLPTAAAAIAPVAGVALGAGLYSANPELWEKISRALLPFCYDDTELLPVAVDENGNTYYPQEAVDAVVNELKDIASTGVSAPTPELNDIYSSGINPYPVQVAKGVTSISCIGVWHGGDGKISKLQFDIVAPNPVNCFLVFNSGNGAFNMVLSSLSSMSFKYSYKRLPNGKEQTTTTYVTNKYTYDGKTIYYSSITVGSAHSDVERLPPENMSPSLTPSIIDNSVVDLFSQNGPISWSSWYENEVTQYPTGVSSWTGVQYPLNPEGIGVVTRIENGEVVRTNPYIPISTPGGQPGVSVESTTPDLKKNESAVVINPWIVPNPSKEDYPQGVIVSPSAPLKDPVPIKDPLLDPNADPSKIPPREPTATTTSDPPPGNSGTTPNPQIPIIPVLPSAATGLLHVYNPTQSQLDAFGSWLWTTFSGDLIDTVSKLFNDPMDAVIGLHELYATPDVSGSSTIRAGFLDSKVSSNLVGSRYTTINCGSIVVQEYYQNYLDYSPYTKCYIYLPFVGIVPVLADDIIGNAVNVTYHVDSYTGCCIAVVTVAREAYSSTVYQFEGNCAVEIPITSGYQSTLMGALIGAGATALTGNPHAGIAAANMGRASLGKNDVSHSGSFGSSYGAMGVKVPYIIVKRPTQKSVVNYNQEYGFPAHKRVTIGACSGYLRAREVHVISPTATDDEKTRIEELLKEGVFVK